MGTKAGIWVDHRKAIVVVFSGKGEEVKEIPSHVEKQVRRTGGARHVGPYKAQDVPADDVHDREYAARLNAFYDQVIGQVPDAESILLLGPGEAKGELRKRFDKNGKGRLIAGVEKADKMTVNQTTARFREFFLDGERHYFAQRSPGRMPAFKNVEK